MAVLVLPPAAAPTSVIRVKGSVVSLGGWQGCNPYKRGVYTMVNGGQDRLDEVGERKLATAGECFEAVG